jgi:uncharacterized membrane protein
LKDWIYKYFPEDDLANIQAAVEKVEKQTSGEIIFSFRRKRTILEKLYKPHELAMKDFNRLKVWKTKERTGILVFIIFDERYYNIIADEGIYAKISNKIWNNQEEKLKSEFRAGNYTEGILDLIKRMGRVLKKEFPVKKGEENFDELKDEIEIN